MIRTTFAAAILALVVAGSAYAHPSIFEQTTDGVYVARDDAGQWAAGMSKDITHQNRAEYQAKKILDLSAVPEAVWQQTRQLRLSAFFTVRDYSWHGAPKPNGLDEAFEVVVNGVVHTYPTNCGAPAWQENGKPGFDWYDFILPREQFVRGINEIILRKAPSDKNDDYLYLAIDLSVKPGNSYVSFSGNQWTQNRLTIPGGNGEYMVRLYLITKDLGVTATWRPGQPDDLADPAKLILYHGSRDAATTPAGLDLRPGQSAHLEWNDQALDRMSALKASVDATGDFHLAWLDDRGAPAKPEPLPAPGQAELPAGRATHPSGLVVSAGAAPAVLKQVQVSATLACRPVTPPPDMAPAIAAPKGAARQCAVRCELQGDTIRLENGSLRCTFSTANQHLQLRSLYNEWTACETARQPDAISLFLVEVKDARYAGSRDFRLQSVKPGAQGFVADLVLPNPPLRATLRIGIENEGLRMGMEIVNTGPAPVDFKLAFPHLAGLALSDDPASDYYFFPWGGGIFNCVPATIRRGYGDHEALYQVMDLYSPQRGGGLSVRADDREGWHKVLALRKHVPGLPALDAQQLGTPASAEYLWTNPLADVPGIGFTYEYLRRTRGPGERFAPADAVLAAHQGDWRVAVTRYADWAHRAWKFRPYPSRLGGAVNMIAAGWGQDALFRDGAYRTDFIGPRTDCIELMSWWDWSPLGPWRTPIDKVKDVLGEGAAKLWEPYFVKDPITGQLMWSNQPGDYDGYNERFGGLPAFREAIRTYQRKGTLVTLYTDPFRLDDGSKAGQAHGREWGVVNENGEYSKAYDVWNPCHDDPDVRAWVAETMERVLRETGADGIRLDEYGHRGFVCYSTQHKHTFAERGITQWQKAVAETVKMVRERTDRVNPKFVVTTEHPGYDYLMQYLDGCITYDLTVQATPLRPLEVNLQRFFFPECKAYELDHRGADLLHRKRFWNGVASFGAYYPDNMYRILRENGDAFASRDCEALIPTVARRVYANRFRAGDKTIYTLYNAAGHTFDGPALPVDVPAGRHLFDLLGCRPCAIENRAVRVYLTRDDVACFALLKQRLTVSLEGRNLVVEAKTDGRPATVALCTDQGAPIGSPVACSGRTTFDLSALPAGVRPACVKLFSGDTLLDIAAVPAR